MKYFPQISKFLFVIFLVLPNLFAQSKLEKAIKLFEDKNYTQANDVLEEILDEDENNAKANFYMGRTYFGLKDYSEASDYIEEAIEIEEHNAEYHFWLAQAYAADAQTSSFISAAFIAPKIKDEFARTIEIDPNHLGGHIGLANFHLNAPGIVGGDIDKVLNVGKKLIKLDEKKGRIVLINYYTKKENFDSVKIQLKIPEENYSEDKSFASFYNTYGYSLLNQEKYEEAIKYFKKQVELKPENANSYDSLGDGYRAIGNLKEAVNQYQKALDIDPNYEPSKNNLAEVTVELESSN